VPLHERFPEVLAAAKEGSATAWESLIGELARGVVGYLRVRGASDPEATAGEVFLDVARSIRRFSGDESGFRAWVFVIAHRRLVDDRRKRDRRRDVPLPPLLLPERPATDQVEEEVLQRVALLDLRRLLDSLSPDQAEVIGLRFVGGFTLEETARLVGKRVGAVKALQHRGLAALRRRIEAGAVSLGKPPTITGA
jgi:RNA polymerase sigma factor (sigma-70 family)